MDYHASSSVFLRSERMNVQFCSNQNDYILIFKNGAELPNFEERENTSSASRAFNGK